jgi:hypothetical protein
MVDLRYSNTKTFYHDWFWWIFRYLPFSYLVGDPRFNIILDAFLYFIIQVKIMDCFFLEGPKVLYRVGLALVHLFIKST